MSGPRTYTLLGTDGKPYRSASKGRWGGHCGTRIYGRLDCPAALRAVGRGGYSRYRVFFADEATAIAAGYRPCASCCPDRYQEWKNTRQQQQPPPEAGLRGTARIRAASHHSPRHAVTVPSGLF
jgi:methylphosphotriester-DNA--protein-cysteine methyltransferase